MTDFTFTRPEQLFPMSQAIRGFNLTEEQIRLAYQWGEHCRDFWRGLAGFTDVQTREVYHDRLPLELLKIISGNFHASVDAERNWRR